MDGDTTICRVGGGVWLLWVLEDGAALHGAVGCTILGSGAPCVWVTGGVYWGSGGKYGGGHGAVIDVGAGGRGVV